MLYCFFCGKMPLKTILFTKNLSIMKKNTFTLLCLFFIFSMNVFSQQSLDFSGNGGSNTTEGYFTKYVPTDKYEEIDGTPYYNDEWISGTIKLKNGVELKIESCKYDVYEGKLIFLKDETPLYFSNPEDINSFMLGSSKFINLKLKNNNDFYEKLLEAENFVLLKKYQCVFIKGKETDGINPATKNKYKVNSNYYYKKENEALKKIKFKEQAILELIPDKKEEIKNYIKENKLNCKDEKDVIKVFEFYSTLI